MAVLCNGSCVDDVVLNFLNVTSEVNGTFAIPSTFSDLFMMRPSAHPPSSRNSSRRPRHANSTTWCIKLYQALEVFFRMLNTSRCSRRRFRGGRGGSLRTTSLGRLVLLRGTICEDQTVSGLAGFEKTLTALWMRQPCPLRSQLRQIRASLVSTSCFCHARSRKLSRTTTTFDHEYEAIPVTVRAPGSLRRRGSAAGSTIFYSKLTTTNLCPRRTLLSTRVRSNHQAFNCARYHTLILG
ncbi:hypothetical protein BDQ17DRAFT_635639 [Cyathus striatus]|nr:hypothetical protein BDQ17DRAFT_635639 [Cyathus striatus]